MLDKYLDDYKYFKKKLEIAEEDFELSKENIIDYMEDTNTQVLVHDNYRLELRLHPKTQKTYLVVYK